MDAASPLRWRQAGGSAEGAQEPTAIQNNFSRIIEGASSVAPSPSGALPVHLEAPRVWVEGAAPPPFRLPVSIASHELPGSPDSLVATVGPPRPKGPPAEFVDVFTNAFTLCCFLAYLMPIYLMTRIGQDVSVKYWFGPWCNITALLPLLFVLGHVVHTKKQVPHKPTVLMCCVFPAVALLILGDSVLRTVSDRAGQFFSTDCDTFPGKRALEREHAAAQSIFATCLTDTVAANPGHNLTLARAAELYRIQDCEEFELQHQVHQRHWDYLRYLEDEHQCGGWCQFGQPIWSYKEMSDSCSVAVSSVFTGKIGHMASQVVVYSLVVLLVVSVGLMFVGAPLRHLGVDW